MFESILFYIVTFLPTIIAVIGELGVVKFAMSVVSKLKETKEFKAVKEQNENLITELHECQKLNKELLTQIDKIARD